MDNFQVVEIEAELKKLHKEQADNKEIRASLFTLIIYVHEEERGKYLREIVQNIIGKYPCRIIFIEADRHTGDNNLQVLVDSIHNNTGGTLIACDQITIKVSGKYLNRVPYLVLPHAIRDLPVYLLWGQDATCPNEMLGQLEKLADRLIFDAECTKDLRHFSRAVLEKQKSSTIELLDINWALCGVWRDALVQAFLLPEHFDLLLQAKQIVITYNCHQSDWVHQPEMQSIYIQAWIASRLGWIFKSMATTQQERRFIYERDGQEVEVILIPQHCKEAAPGSILNFELSSENGCSFLLKHDPSQSTIVVHCSSQKTCELPFSLSLVDSRRGIAFMNEIFYSSPSQHYIQTLELLSQIN